MALKPKEFKITEKDKGAIFKALLDKTYLEVGHLFGVHAHYTSDSGVRVAVMKIYNEVKANPEKFGLKPDFAEAVTTAVENRKVAPHKAIRKTESAVLDPEDTKAVVIGGRNKAAMLLHKKMDMIDKSKDMLKRENLVSLAKVFGIFFDKAQIVQGQATEHIAVLAKGIPDGMTPTDALNALLTMREATVAQGVDEPKSTAKEAHLI
jgi:hypothetical protein